VRRDGKPADSKEHVIPGWISKRPGIKTFLTQTSSGGCVVPQKRPISFASHRKRIFCTSCNTHFKHLEDAVIPPLVPMARGFHFALDRESQQLLALWATKTAIALIAATDGLAGAVRIVHRRAVRENAEVPEGVWVGFFSWRGEPTIATSRFVSVDEGQVSAYGAVLAFTGVGFSVKGFERPEPAETLDGDAPNLDLTAIKDASARARGALRDGKATAASLLTAALAGRDDPLLVELKDDAARSSGVPNSSFATRERCTRA
jgi:hypothetical protein